MVAKMKKIRSELEFKKWFEKNFKKLGYSKIIRKDNGKFPDFIMLKKGKEIRVELETLSSNFIFHKHDKEKVDEIVCIKKDVDIKIPIIEIKELRYISRIKRISATVNEETINIINLLLKDGNYRNKSHVIEKAIEILKKMEDDKKK